jgi:hypothetical protein
MGKSIEVARTEQIMKASPEQVFEILSDGWTYSDWVVGTAHIRAVDPGWPALGSRIHFKAGPWPVSLRDCTTSLRCEPPNLLVVQPRLWPLGEVQVTIELTETRRGWTLVTMHEEFVEGPMRWIRSKVDDLLLHLRNRESLRRLADLAARRAGDGGPATQSIPTDAGSRGEA